MHESNDSPHHHLIRLNDLSKCIFWENFSPLPKLLLNDPTSIASCLVDSVTPRRVCSRSECAKAYRKQQECRDRAVAATLVHPYYWGTAGALNTLHITWCNTLTEWGEIRTKAAAFTALVMCFTGFDQCWNLWRILDVAVHVPPPLHLPWEQIKKKARPRTNQCYRKKIRIMD